MGWESEACYTEGAVCQSPGREMPEHQKQQKRENAKMIQDKAAKAYVPDHDIGVQSWDTKGF